MRLLRLLAPLAVLSVSIWMMTGSGAFPYIALLLATGAGAALMLVTMTSVYSADQLRLTKPIHGFKPIRDYASLRAMAYRLMNRASSTAIASAEVSHYADLMAQRLTQQEAMASDASSSMNAINAAIMQVSASASHVRQVITIMMSWLILLAI